jgi:hypothetical protein
MKKTKTLKSKGAEPDFPSIESFLGSALKPIQPRAIFVTGLRSKLVTEARSRPAGLTLPQFLILVAIGIGSSILLVLTGTRAIIAVLGVLGFIRLSSGQHQKKPPVTMISAS